MQLKAAAVKVKEKARLQMVKDEDTQRKALIVNRAPTAYALFVKDQFAALGHLSVTQRFQVRLCNSPYRVPTKQGISFDVNHHFDERYRLLRTAQWVSECG